MEIDKRLLDKSWRISHLYKITTKDSQLVQFKRNRAQEHFAANRHSRNIILKSRQLGFTTDECIDALDDCLFNRNFQALVLSYDQDSTYKIFADKIRLAWNNFPLQSAFTVDAERADALRVDFGDKTFSSISVKTSGRSGTYQRVHISEFAKICKEYPDRAREIITGTIPAIPINGRVDIESTAEGEFGYFHDMFWEAWNRDRDPKPTEYKAHFYNWTWDDEEIARISDVPLILKELSPDFLAYQQKHSLSDQQICYYYLKYLSLNKSWALLRQEYPTTPEEAFESSGDKLFNLEALEKQLTTEGTDYGDWTLFDNFHPSHRYAIGADVAEGVGRDSSTAVIFDFTDNAVAGIYKSNQIAPDLFAYELKTMGHKFGTCLIAPERNNHGWATITKLKDIYPEFKIYREKKQDLYEKETNKYGWHTTVGTKPNMLYDLASAINENEIRINSKPLLQELKTYDKSDLQITRGNEETKHWDLVMALAIAFQMRSDATAAPKPLDYNIKAPTFKWRKSQKTYKDSF